MMCGAYKSVIQSETILKKKFKSVCAASSVDMSDLIGHFKNSDETERACLDEPESESYCEEIAAP